MRFDQTMAQVLERDICKFNVRTPDEGLGRELSAYLAERPDALVNAPFKPVMFEISRADVNKGAALAWLAAHLGIAEDEVAVYGDGGNDIQMLERFAHAYAPSNANAAAKRAAGTVIGSNVAYAVPRHMVRTVRAPARSVRGRVARRSASASMRRGVRGGVVRAHLGV